MKNDQKIKENSQMVLDSLHKMNESELSALVEKHNRRYFVENAPEITDEAFDKIVEALRLKNPKAKALKQIGYQTGFGQSVVHRYPMLSLDKCYEDDVFFKWSEKINGDLIVMPKVDGVASSLIYDGEGRLMLAATRGDGVSGENITKNISLIEGLPLTLPKSMVDKLAPGEEFIDVRGEIFLSLERFRTKFASDFANPRNLAAGALKQKESEKSRAIGLQFFPYDMRGSIASTEEEKFIFLTECGFLMMPWYKIPNDENSVKWFLDFQKKRDSFDYEIDGVVFRANLLSEQRRLGSTAHHPRYALAFKFQGESAQTKLVGVEWSCARSGVITPVALVKPVFASGAYISRASLHNLGQFLRLELCEESLVEINRRGGVIPHLERVLSTKGQKLLPPDSCPSCGGPVRVDGDFLYCMNPNGCSETVVASLLHFCHVLGIDGLGEKIIRNLYADKYIKTFADIFRIDTEILSNIDRMGDVLAKKLVEHVSSSRNIELATFIQALGINEIGANVAGLIASHFQTLPKIRSLTIEDLLPIHGIGERIAESLIVGLKELSPQIDDLLTLVSVKDFGSDQNDFDATHPLFEASVIFTGKMAHLDRKSAQDLVQQFGGKTPGSLTAKVDYLVIGDEGSPITGQGVKSSKQKAAEKLKSSGSLIKIISETEFMKLAQKK